MEELKAGQSDWTKGLTQGMQCMFAGRWRFGEMRVAVVVIVKMKGAKTDL